MAKPVKVYVSQRTRPNTIANIIKSTFIINPQRTIELYPQNHEAMTRVSEGMMIAQCQGEVIPDGDSIKLVIAGSES